MSRGLWVFLLWLCPAMALAQVDAPEPIRLDSEFAATDTLACGTDASADANNCLDHLSWPPMAFTVRIEAAEPGCGNWLVRFPSARPIGNDANDLASMEWYFAHDQTRAIRQARAIVIVHESGRQMTVGRLIARGFSAQGLHAFLLHLPGYGARRVEGLTGIEHVFPALQQAIADVRRARDVVVALPTVDHSVVGVQGTSLGGFVTATVAGLDRGYDRVFILLAGGDLQEVVLHGAKDAARIHEKLVAAGMTEERIKELARHVEPLRLAHRINPAATWLYSGKFDDVVPPSCSLALAKAARLSKDHHIELPADHYSGILFLPQVVQQMYRRMIEPLEVDHKRDASPTAPRTRAR